MKKKPMCTDERTHDKSVHHHTDPSHESWRHFLDVFPDEVINENGISLGAPFTFLHLTLEHFCLQDWVLRVP